MKKVNFQGLLTLLILVLCAPIVPAQSLEQWPPPLPGAVNHTVTVTTNDCLQVPESVKTALLKDDAVSFVMAKTPPTVELAYHGDLPDRALNGTGWTSWGDILVAKDGKVYSGIGNHGQNLRQSPNDASQGYIVGQSFVYSWDPHKKALNKIADLNKIAGVSEGDVAWSKVHAGIHEDRDGHIYFTGTLNDGGRSFQMKWTNQVPGGQLFRYNPQTGETQIVASFPGEVTPTTELDATRGVWYANLEGKFKRGDVALTAVDIQTGKVLYQSAHDAVVASRNLALAQDGAVYFNGKNGLWKYDPVSKKITPTKSAFPGTSTMRSSTGETGKGTIYGTTTRPGQLFRYWPAQDKLEMLGPDFLSGNYTTVTVLSPDEKYVYFLPGAHGGAAEIGTPVVQYEIATGKRKVLGFLRAGLEEAVNYTPAGTYGVKISADGSTLYVGFNGQLAHETNPPKKAAKNFGLTAFAAIHIPATERE